MNPVYRFLACCFLVLPAALCDDDGEQFRLALDPVTQEISDASKGRKVTVTGGEIVSDDRFGSALAFGSSDRNHIAIENNPAFDFSDGFTFEAWMKFGAKNVEEINGGFFAKMGTGVTSFGKGKLRVDWLVFPTENVFVAEKGQLGYHPVDSQSFSGARQVPIGQWVRVALTYDPVRKVIRSWLDGGEDRVRHLVAETPMPLQTDEQRGITLFQGLKDFQVADVKILGRAETFAPVPSLEVYAHQLPYATTPQLGLLLDHIDPGLKFPVEVTVYWENHTGSGNIIDRFSLDGPERRTERIDVPGWPNAPYTVIVHAYEQNREIYRKQFNVVNPRAPLDARVRIEPDLNISVAGKKIFPILIYRVPPEDFAAAKEMGFNLATPAEWQSIAAAYRFTHDTSERLARWYDAADKAGIFLMSDFLSEEAVIRFRNEKSLLGWYLADEPWGQSFERLRILYNAAKLLAPGVPSIIVQNNSTRVQETSEMADIIGRDPYPIPSVPFRAIVDETRQTIRDSGGFKPVWIVLPQYEGKIPTLEQLRCMVWLAIAAGADGIGIYSWDDRALDSQTGDRTVNPTTGSRGWYLPEHPQEMQNLKSVISELAGLQNMLIAKNDPSVNVESSDNKAVHIALKQAADGDYLILASDSRQTEKSTLTLPGNVSGQGREVFGKSGQLVVKDGTASVELPPYGVSVFRFTAGTFKK